MSKAVRNILFIIGALALVCIGFFVLKGAYNRFYMAAYPIKYEEYVTKYSSEYDVDDALVYAVIRSESSFKPSAVSDIGARGLMQITEPTFEWALYRMGGTDIVYEDMFDPEQNIRFGTFILSLLLEEFGSPETALAAYHGGWGSVKGWLADPQYSSDGETLDEIPFWDTKSYVPKVIGTMEKYKKLYGI